MSSNKNQIKYMVEKSQCINCHLILTKMHNIYEFEFSTQYNKLFILSIKSSARLMKDGVTIGTNQFIYTKNYMQVIEDRMLQIEIKQESMDIEAFRYKEFCKLIGLKVISIEILDYMLWIYFENNYKINIFLHSEFDLEEHEQYIILKI